MAVEWAAILETCEPYVVASPAGSVGDVRPRLPGIAIPDVRRLDPHRVDVEPFVACLARLDALVGSDLDMALPRWALYDCGVVAGAVFGFARAPHDLPRALLDRLEVDSGSTGLVPVSMVVVLPLPGPGAWHTFALRSVNQTFPGAVPRGLRLMTEVLALSCLEARSGWVATPWRAPAVPVLARFGPIELVTAWTPAHTHPATFTGRFDASAGRLAAAITPGAAVAAREAPDEERLREIQVRLEAGRRYEVTAALEVREVSA